MLQVRPKKQKKKPQKTNKQKQNKTKQKREKERKVEPLEAQLFAVISFVLCDSCKDFVYTQVSIPMVTFNTDTPSNICTALVQKIGFAA